MSELRPWLDERRPPAPPELRSAVDTAVEMSLEGAATPGFPDALTDATRQRLEEAFARPGRVRESAFALLTADALLTYASEAALEADDPDAALRELLSALLEATDRP